MITYSVGNVEIQWLIRVMTTKIPKNIRIPHFGVCIQFVAASSATKVVKFFFYFFFCCFVCEWFFFTLWFQIVWVDWILRFDWSINKRTKEKKTPGKRNLENTKILTVQFFFHTPLFPFPTNYSGRTKFFFSFFHSFIRITNFAHFLVRFFLYILFPFLLLFLSLISQLTIQINNVL